jgi:hypothetical protein
LIHPVCWHSGDPRFASLLSAESFTARVELAKSSSVYRDQPLWTTCPQDQRPFLVGVFEKSRHYTHRVCASNTKRALTNAPWYDEAPPYDRMSDERVAGYPFVGVNTRESVMGMTWVLFGFRISSPSFPTALRHPTPTGRQRPRPTGRQADQVTVPAAEEFEPGLGI